MTDKKVSFDRLLRMFLVPVSRFSVLLAGFYSFMWGLWVANPMWSTFPQSPVYEVLSWSGSEFAWGLIQMAVGVGLILAAFDSLRFIKYATFAGFISWLLIAISFAISNFQSPGMWVTGYLAATNAYFFLNFARRHKIES
jgi:hypothetical protein